MPGNWWEVEDNVKNILGYEDPSLIVERPIPRKYPSTIKKPEQSDKNIPYSDGVGKMDELAKEMLKYRAEQEDKLNQLKKSQTQSSKSRGMMSSSSSTSRSGGVNYHDPKINSSAPSSGTPNFRDNKNMVDNFKQDEDIKNAFNLLINADPTTQPDYADSEPPNKNLDIANSILNEDAVDRYKNRNRTDLSSLMALADFWTKGKSNLAGAYKPPESDDSVIQKMMALRAKEIKDRNDLEIEQYKAISEDRYKNITRPAEAAAGMLGTIHQGQGKNQTLLDSKMNDIMARLLESKDRNKTAIIINSNNNETKAAKMKMDADRANAELAVKREKLAYSTGGVDGVKKAAKFEEDLHRSLAQAMLPKGNLEKNDQNWNEIKQKFKNIATKLTYQTIREFDLINENDGDMDSAMKQANEYLRSTYDPISMQFESPTINGYFQQLRTRKNSN